MSILPSGLLSSNKKYFVYLFVGLLTFGVTYAALTFLLPEEILDKIKTTSRSIVGGNLKACGEGEKAEEKPTTLNGKVVLRIRDKESQLLDLGTNKRTTLDTKDDNPITHFSPDGEYIVYLQEIRPESGKTTKKFFFFNTSTGSRKQLKTNFKDSGGRNLMVKWSNDNKQFLISQGGDVKKGSTDFEYWVDYFNVSDLIPHASKDLAEAIGDPKVFIYGFPNENEVVLSENKSDKPNPTSDTENNNIKYEFSKFNLSEGKVETLNNYSFKLPVGAVGRFSPDYKYYVFVEKESLSSKNIPTSEDSLKNLKPQKAYIGYVNLELNCIKKIEITEVPIYFNSEIATEQFSEDSNKVLIKIHSLDFSNKAENLQWWRMDIATLTKPNQKTKSTIGGDQINSIVKMSSQFNYAVVTTVKSKYYLYDLRDGKAIPITSNPAKASPYSFWLKETAK
jgi:hypothetical protein